MAEIPQMYIAEEEVLMEISIEKILESISKNNDQSTGRTAKTQRIPRIMGLEQVLKN